MRTIFHITTRSAWDTALKCGSYVGDTLASEGFIHFSRPHQLLSVAQARFSGHKDLLLLQVAQELVTAPVKYEGDAVDPFPHVYGPLNNNAVLSVYDFAESAGKFQLPNKFSLVNETLIRSGVPGDEAEIASVHTHAWQQSYANIVPATALDSRSLSFRNRMNWWRSVVNGADDSRVLVAESKPHGIIAFCAFGPAREVEFANQGEIFAIYALNEYKSKGIGAALFRTARQEMKTKGFHEFYVWVLKENPTCAFYLRMGGKASAREKIVDLGQPLVEIAYEWKNEAGE